VLTYKLVLQYVSKHFVKSSLKLLLKTTPPPPKVLSKNGTFWDIRLSTDGIIHPAPSTRAQCISTLSFSADACRVTQVTHELHNCSCGLSMKHNIFYPDINGTTAVSCQCNQLLVITHRWSVVNTIH